MDDLCEANGSFAISLLKILGEEDKSRNLFFCPLSVSSALAMVYLGAKGNTAAQMSQVCLLEVVGRGKGEKNSRLVSAPYSRGSVCILRQWVEVSVADGWRRDTVVILMWASTGGR